MLMREVVFNNTPSTEKVGPHQTNLLSPVTLFGTAYVHHW